MTAPKATPGVTRRLVLAALGAFISQHGYSPTVRELAAACGIGVSACYSHLTQLMAEGKVTEQPGRSRTLRVVQPEGAR
jgi:SOS-response transcriptional repressor LexA